MATETTELEQVAIDGDEPSANPIADAHARYLAAWEAQGREVGKYTCGRCEVVVRAPVVLPSSEKRAEICPQCGHLNVVQIERSL
jgi:ribosomal protein S27AE